MTQTSTTIIQAHCPRLAPHPLRVFVAILVLVEQGELQSPSSHRYLFWQPPGEQTMGSLLQLPSCVPVEFDATSNANNPACALSLSSNMWRLLMLLCSQAIDFSAGFTTPSALNSDKSQFRKPHDPESFMNVVSLVAFSFFLSKVSLSIPLPLPHH